MQSESNAKEAAHSKAVREMFAGIAGRYDLLNHLLSLNIDKRWRRALRDELHDILQRGDAVVLDVACGTGDLSIALAERSPALVVGTDFCRPMLAIAENKITAARLDVPLVEGDAMSLSFPDGSFDAVTIAFGLRNLPNVPRGVDELYRVLKPGGKLAILEFSTPVVPGCGRLFNFYFSHILPRIGGAVSGSRGAYEYLPDSVSKFPDQKKLSALMTDSGFVDVRFRNLTGGIAALHVGGK
ncbi:MAG TPA: bifunctional demethylmenaquinone methyltransferase/2-methoxy-6-polyprenyl-1,4-benzoquinol methylase UbiE [Pyrinomonadaceae bacterium]|nr:bifunctional demethylmenaquinone methyltransferase/2-methoxy-6-polyprenyl-1,4-benzoquinol methylase UbiE [Pyrinomonadaceae bacterium]